MAMTGSEIAKGGFRNEQEALRDYLQKNIIMIISDVIRGRGRFAAEWTLYKTWKYYIAKKRWR